jgi:hypothetical protein
VPPIEFEGVLRVRRVPQVALAVKLRHLDFNAVIGQWERLRV